MAEVPVAVVWLISVVLVVAACIDGRQLRVPNWLTFPFAAVGLAYSCFAGGWQGLLLSLAGLAVGLITLLPLHSIGGMGAGDVKLMAGLGAWIGPVHTLGAFVATALVGGLIAALMMLASGDLIRHWVMFQIISHEILTIRNPGELAARAAERKKTMTLLPYGIPIAIGSIGYFYLGWMGLLF